ncbi:hypothetical protein [Brevibacillus borstelensis]|nr:hypothetical protein [Brevibacillus borstelensis]
MEKFLCLDCDHRFEVSDRKAKSIDGTNCPECEGRIIPVAE